MIGWAVFWVRLGLVGPKVALKVALKVRYKVDYKVGDRVGVGCIVDSCLDCGGCRAGEEQLCSNGG